MDAILSLIDTSVPWHNPHIDDIQEAVLFTLAYSDVFDYPLTLDEVHRYLIGVTASRAEVASALAASLSIEKDGAYYHFPDRDGIVTLRRRRQVVASEMWHRALRYARLIARLPFVRMVALTGALTMGNVEPDDDLDYLIVTEPGRLWLTRAMVIGLVVKRGALNRDEVCPNYLLTTDHLEIPDHDLFTAHELAQMVPLVGRPIYDRMRAVNGWILDFLPNATGAPSEGPGEIDVRPALLQPVAESILLSGVAERIERWEMARKMTKLNGGDPACSEVALSSDCCKGHVDAHHRRVYEAFRERVADIEELRGR